MKPILYESTETQFNTNGIGVLSDAVSCISKQTLNGRCDITLQYPINGLHAKELKSRNIIYVLADPSKGPQPFRIKHITKISNDLISVQANHLAYDLDGVAVTPFTAESAPAALAGFTANAVNDCPFTFYTDKTTAAKFSVALPSTVWPLLGGSAGSILDVYGGEYDFDRYTVKLLQRRGADRGVSIRYGKNLTTLEQDENCANCYTGVLPFYVDKETGSVTMLPDKVVPAEGKYNYSRIYPLDLSASFEQTPTEAQLTAAAQDYMKANDIGKPVVGWKVEFVPLEKTDEYTDLAPLEQICMGDSVYAEFPDMEVSASARAVEAEFDCLQEKYNYVYLGSVKASLADTIAAQSQQLSRIPTDSQMMRTINQLTSAILGASGGSARLLDANGDSMPDALYIADDPDPIKAKKVWRFNYEGWGASQNGYNGPFVMGASFDSGIIADFITAGTLYGILIKAGSIQSIDGKISIDLSNGSQPVFNTGIVTNGLSVRGESVGAGELFSAKASQYTKTDGSTANTFAVGFHSVDGTNVGGFSETWADSSMENPIGMNLQMYSHDKKSRVLANAGNGVNIDLYANGERVGRFYTNGSAESVLVVDRIGTMKISWKSNGDGTYTLIGQ